MERSMVFFGRNEIWILPERSLKRILQRRAPVSPQDATYLVYRSSLHDSQKVQLSISWCERYWYRQPGEAKSLSWCPAQLILGQQA